jgi:biotin/methionine sulfoxide reductase
VVHEIAWTATARHADIVLPCTMTLEREDIGRVHHRPADGGDAPIAEPYGEARDDYSIFAALAARLGKEQDFTEGRDARGWLRHLYERTMRRAGRARPSAPDFDTFWAARRADAAAGGRYGGILRAFRVTRRRTRCRRRAARMEIFSATIAGFGYDDCPGHPTWLSRWMYPMTPPRWIVANQPATRLHSQLDFGGTSAKSKRRGREVMRMHPADAAARGIVEGDVVRLFNGRGACLAAAALSEAVAPAWCSCRPAPGTTRWTRRKTSPSASTATRMC